jgi:CBS domain containing-hemolysin-like protein
MEQSMAGILWRLAGVVALVFANGFFVSAEYSIVTVRKTRVDQLVAEGNRRARAVRRAITQPDRYIAATQLGVTMASLGLGWIGEPALASLIEPLFVSLPATIAATTAHSIAVAIAFTLITAFHIVFGELAPKWVALERAESVAMWVVKPCEIFMRALSPFIRVLHGFAQGVVKMAGLKRRSDRSVHSEEELKMLVTASQEAGVLEEQEEQMLHRVFDFADLTAGQVMVPRTELVGIEAGASFDAVVQLVAKTGYARLPVYRNDLDNVIGILYVTDMIRALPAGSRTSTAGALAREALTVPETLGADDLLAALKRRGVREAIVIDEYGGTAGLVTLDSLVERIVGVVGGAPGGAERIVVHADGSADIDGLALVTDVNEQFDMKIDEDVYTTIGGYMLGRVGRRPKIGDAIDIDGRKMRVVALDGLRVAKVWLSKPAHTEPAPADGREP